MKKYILSIAALLIVGMSAKAQFTLGIKGGVNFSKINTDNLNESTKTGYQGGVWARFGKGLYLQPELYIGTKGGKIDFTTSGNTTQTGEQKFTTLDVPLLVGQSFGDKSLNFRVMAGPMYTSYLSRSDNFSTAINNAYNDFGSYKNSSLGFQAGAGIDISSLSVDLRYEGALTKINDKYGERPSLWHLSVGFKIF